MILSLCKRLINLNFCELSRYRSSTTSFLDLSSTNCMSSTLTVLKINVETFDDCLYLLDGRLDCLSTLIIHVDRISFSLKTVDNTVSMIFNYCVSRKKSELNT